MGGKWNGESSQQKHGTRGRRRRGRRRRQTLIAAASQQPNTSLGRMVFIHTQPDELSTEIKLKREDVKKWFPIPFSSYICCMLCTYLKIHPCGSECTYVKFIHTLPSTMVIKVRPKKVIYMINIYNILRVMKWYVDSMFKSKVYEHNYIWVFLSSDHEAKGIFPSWSTLLKIWYQMEK